MESKQTVTASGNAPRTLKHSDRNQWQTLAGFREYYDPQTQGICFEMGSRKVHTFITGGKHKYHSRLYVNGGETATTTEAKHATSIGARRWAAKILSERFTQACEGWHRQGTDPYDVQGHYDDAVARHQKNIERDESRQSRICKTQ